MIKYEAFVTQNRANHEGEVLKEAIKATKKSQRKHSWYMDETLIPLSLCNNELPDEEREVIAKAIYNFPVPESLEAFKHSPRSNGILLDLLDFTSDTPSLKPLVGENSWFIFKILGIDGPAQRFWLNLKPDTWEEIVPYRTLCRFVKTLAVVNDESERGVRVAEDYTKRVKNETMRQDLFQCIQRRREILKLYGTRNKKDLQQSFSALSKKNA